MTDIFERHVIARNSFLYFVVATNGAWKCCAIIFGKEYLILSILFYSQKSDRGKLSTRFRREHFAAGRPALECNWLLMHGEPPWWTLLFLTFSQWFLVWLYTWMRISCLCCANISWVIFWCLKCHVQSSFCRHNAVEEPCIGQITSICA